MCAWLKSVKTGNGGCFIIMLKTKQTAKVEKFDKPYGVRFVEDMRRNWGLYLMFLPILIYFIVFHYFPMFGIAMAFKDFSPIRGIFGSEWVGFKHFADFLGSSDFGKIVWNTFNIAYQSLLWNFPAPIILALLFNELKSVTWKRTVQTATYLPHFVSLVVVCGIIKTFVAQDGIITYLLSSVGLVDKVNLLGYKEYYIPIYIFSGMWKEVGYSSIIYIAALAAVDQELYEAAAVDGAGRFRQLFAVTLPGIMPTIVVKFIMATSGLLAVGMEKTILLYNPLTYEVADVISSYVYRRGLLELNYSYSAAVGLFNSIIGYTLVVSANKLSKKVNDMSIW